MLWKSGTKHKTFKLNSRENPPWLLSQNNINLTLHTYKKDQQNPIQFQTLFEEIRENLPFHRFIFTDGSRSKKLVSYSVTTDKDTIITSILPPYSSILSAEMIAIYKAVKFVENKNQKHAICNMLRLFIRIKNDFKHFQQ